MRLHLDAAAVPLDDVAGDRQAEAEALIAFARASRGVGLEEWFEDLLVEVCGNASYYLLTQGVRRFLYFGSLPIEGDHDGRNHMRCLRRRAKDCADRLCACAGAVRLRHRTDDHGGIARLL
jgi:hypothetical protein